MPWVLFYLSSKGKHNDNEDDEPSIGAQKTEDRDCPYRTAKTNIRRVGGKPFAIATTAMMEMNRDELLPVPIYNRHMALMNIKLPPETYHHEEFWD